MADVALLLLPLAALALVAIAGIGIVALLAPDLPADAAAAFAPLAGAAWLAVASTLLPLGVPAKPLAAATVGAAVVLAVAVRSRVRELARAAAVPAAIALGAGALAGTPAVARGDWRATSLYESTDAYHWVSQGRAYFEGPAPAPVSEHPDRLTYERSRTQHWAVAVPFGAGLTGWLARSDVVDAYGALAAALFALLPLAAYAAARAVLGWGTRLAAVAGAALALNASLLFASHFSWQQQVVGSALAFAAAALLWLGLRREASGRVVLLAGVLAAGAIGTYRLGFAPFLAALLAAVALACLWRGGDRRKVARRIGVFAGAAAALAALSLVALVRGLPRFVDSGGFSTAFKEGFARGQPGEALGLVPHVWAVEGEWADPLRIGWLAAGSVIAAWLLVVGARRSRPGGFVLTGTTLVAAGYALLLLPSFAPYLSYKLLAYGAPFLVLLALAPLAEPSGRVARGGPAAAAVLLVASSAVATVTATRETVAAPRLAPFRELPGNAIVTVSTDDPWRQAWELYGLRDVRVSVERPTYLLTEQGVEHRLDYRNRPISHAVVYTAAGVATVVPAASRTTAVGR